MITVAIAEGKYSPSCVFLDASGKWFHLRDKLQHSFRGATTKGFLENKSNGFTSATITYHSELEKWE